MTSPDLRSTTTPHNPPKPGFSTRSNSSVVVCHSAAGGAANTSTRDPKTTPHMPFMVNLLSLHGQLGQGHDVPHARPHIPEPGLGEREFGRIRQPRHVASRMAQ